jgi:hypothetical protein
LPPIALPDGRKPKTLADCRAYILALPEREQEAIHWQHATQALLKAAEHGGPFCFIARIAVSRALNSVTGVDKGEKAGAREGPQEGTMTDKRPMLDGRELSELELARIRRQIESLETIDVVSDEMRALIEQQWPHLLAKIRAPTRSPSGH